MLACGAKTTRLIERGGRESPKGKNEKSMITTIARAAFLGEEPSRPFNRMEIFDINPLKDKQACEGDQNVAKRIALKPD